MSEEQPVEAEVVDERAFAIEKLLDQWWAILALLFGVTGALGLPFLWKSRAFGATMKIILSIVVTAYTVLLIWITKMILWWSYHRVMDSL